MIGGVTRQMLPHLSGVPHLHVNRPLVLSLQTNNQSECDAFFARALTTKREARGKPKTTNKKFTYAN